jgi:NAD(P)-dependent dehydrogenase (short-subunit alcohol dehydrogenase family)
MEQLDKMMIGKVCMVTGATSGIGKVTARVLAERGATVVVVGRDPAKSAGTVAEITRRSGNQAVEFLVADLSSQQQVRQLAAQFKNRHQHLHVLVNNAGAIYLSRQQSVDGIELSWALNHLNYFLLTNLLLDTILASAPGRIINVSSRQHQIATINFDDLEGKRRYSGMFAYGQSKLANILFTYELAKRLEGTGVTVNTLHPGMVATNFAANNGPLTRLARPLLNLVSISAEEGAQTIIYLATSPEVESITGKYFVNKQAVPSSQESYDKVTARRVWQVSEELIGSHASSLDPVKAPR